MLRTTTWARAQFTVFEMKHLLALDDRVALPVLLYLFRRVEQRLDGRPTLIEIDEAWMALMHPRFGARITQWLLTLRKQNAAVVLATQSPAQLAQLPGRHAIVESCPTKFYLPNADAAAPASADLYHDFGLNAREIAPIIAAATPKRHYYVKLHAREPAVRARAGAAGVGSHDSACRPDGGGCQAAHGGADARMPRSVARGLARAARTEAGCGDAAAVRRFAPMLSALVPDVHARRFHI